MFPARLAGIGKGLLARNWVVGAAAVMIDEAASPPQILLAEHSYRRSGAWGLPGGSLESIPGSPTTPREDASPDDVLESTLRREVWEELGIDITEIRLLRVDAVPYVREEPGPYRLDFYFRCVPLQGFAALREGLKAGSIKPRSPEIKQIRLVALTDVDKFDLFSADARFVKEDLARLEPSLAAALHDRSEDNGPPSARP
jgi:8-oxo-dGTP pyrophosphatase MutT (NUDIX family)